MTLPLHIAEKWQMLAHGGQLPESKVKHALTNELIEDGIIAVRLTGRTKKTLYVTDAAAFHTWLSNKLSISDLQAYIQALKAADATRAELVAVSSDSKTKSTRTFKGFLVNSYRPVDCVLNGLPFVVHPPHGSFQFIHDFEGFIPAVDAVIVGVENSENFSRIDMQRHLFGDLKTLFVSRYPQGQSRDMISWLLSIPNPYLHFGDYDFAGISIYLHEYKKHLEERATFFIPENIEELIEKYGNRKLYDRQQFNAANIVGEDVQKLISLIHKYKKGLEQEALLIGNVAPDVLKGTRR